MDAAIAPPLPGTAEDRMYSFSAEGMRQQRQIGYLLNLTAEMQESLGKMKVIGLILVLLAN